MRVLRGEGTGQVVGGLPIGRGTLLAVATSSALTAFLYLSWWDVTFAFQQPRFWFALCVPCAAVLLRRHVSPPIAIWWLLGAVTIFWSLAPGATAVSLLWEAANVVAFAAGWWRVGAAVLSVALLAAGLETALSLSVFGSAAYVSGSVHYIVGAQALAVVPLAFRWLFNGAMLTLRVGSGLLLLVSTYAVLMSGARAVYLPFVLVTMAMVVRASAGSKAKWLPATVVVITLLVTMGVDQVVPGSPVQTALGTKAVPGVQAEGLSEHGVFSQRLRLWEQTVSMAVGHPLGTGAGTYAAVTHAFQKYPMLWSRSAHNYYLETLATGGWLRFTVLVILLGGALWRAWRSSSWHWSLAAAGLWATLAFDVTSLYPIFMMYAFLMLGASNARLETADPNEAGATS